MDLNRRLHGYSNICGIELDYSGIAVPAYEDFQQRFYDSRMLGSNRKGVYYGPRTVNFSEVSDTTRAGIFFKQTITLQFSNFDHQVIDRLNSFLKVKYIHLRNSSGKEFVIGRNDVTQNRKPKVELKRSLNVTQVMFTTESITPSGFNDSHLNLGLPHDVPVYLFD
jgi:hypothetical protein